LGNRIEELGIRIWDFEISIRANLQVRKLSEHSGIPLKVKYQSSQSEKIQAEQIAVL